MDSNRLNKAFDSLGLGKIPLKKIKNPKVEKALTDLFEKAKKVKKETASLPIDKQRAVVVELADEIKAQFKKDGSVDDELKNKYKKELAKYNKSYRSAERIIGNMLD